jgi:SAM-dependent methyltransferase
MLSLEKQNRLREAYRRKHPHWQPATEVFAAAVRANLASEVRLLDLGCGRGGLVEQLAHDRAQMIGVDPDFDSLVEHRLRMPRAQARSAQLPFASASFDLVLASWLLEHLETPTRDFCEVGRVLRPGGAFIFITPNGAHPLSFLNRLMGRLERTQGWLVSRLYGRAAADAFPAYYRANTRATLAVLAGAAHMDLSLLHAIPDPTYLAFTPALFQVMQSIEGRLPSSRALHLVGIMHKAVQ